MIAVLVGGALVGVARVVLDAIKALARYLIRRWHVHDEIALFIGTAIVAALIITVGQRRAGPRLRRRRQPRVPAAECQHPAGHQPADPARKVRQPRLFR